MTSYVSSFAVLFNSNFSSTDGTLLDYAKKLSRHVREVAADDKRPDISTNDVQTTTTEPETTTFEAEATTTKPSEILDLSDFGDIFGSLFLSFLTNGDNSTNNATSTEDTESLLTALLSIFFDEPSSSTDGEEDDGSISSFLKQVQL